MGQFNKTVGFLDQALSLQADETCWFQREIASILWSHLDASVLTFNYDAIVDPHLKDGCCKKVPLQEYMALSAAGMRSTLLLSPSSQYQQYLDQSQSFLHHSCI